MVVDEAVREARPAEVPVEHLRKVVHSSEVAEVDSQVVVPNLATVVDLEEEAAAEAALAEEDRVGVDRDTEMQRSIRSWGSTTSACRSVVGC